MKIHYKQITKLFFFSFLIFAFAFAFPPVSSAIINKTPSTNTNTKKRVIKPLITNKKETLQTQKTEKICQAITNQAEKIKNRLTNRINQNNQKRIAINAKITQSRAIRLAQIDQNRKNRKNKLTKIWKELEDKAQTDKQKTAVKKFEQSVQNAINIKNNALDKIATNFRVTAKNKLDAKRSEINTQITIYKNMVLSIINQITSDCKNNSKSAKEIRETYRNAIKKSRTEFQTNKKTINTLKDELTLLKENKRSEALTVRETFKNSIETAKTKFRASFLSTAK